MDMKPRTEYCIFADVREYSGCVGIARHNYSLTTPVTNSWRWRFQSWRRNAR